jgi:hypothetical protein
MITGIDEENMTVEEFLTQQCTHIITVCQFITTSLDPLGTFIILLLRSCRIYESTVMF